MTKIEFRRKALEVFWYLGGALPKHGPLLRGWYGEWFARRHLKKLGFSIIAQNWRSPFDRRREIDFIAMKGESLVFVEVRARSKQALINGYHSLTNKKRKVLLTACKDFLRCAGDHPCYRFDVIEVDIGGSSSSLFHHENVSLFP